MGVPEEANTQRNKTLATADLVRDCRLTKQLEVAAWDNSWQRLNKFFGKRNLLVGGRKGAPDRMSRLVRAMAGRIEAVILVAISTGTALLARLRLMRLGVILGGIVQDGRTCRCETGLPAILFSQHLASLSSPIACAGLPRNPLAQPRNPTNTVSQNNRCSEKTQTPRKTIEQCQLRLHSCGSCAKRVPRQEEVSLTATGKRVSCVSRF